MEPLNRNNIPMYSSDLAFRPTEVPEPEENNSRIKIRDVSEPCILLGIGSSLSVLVYSFVDSIGWMSVISSVILLSGCVSEYRVRKLSLAKDLSESVDVLGKENEKLKIEVHKLEDDVSKLDSIVGVVGNTSTSLKNTRDKLIELYNKYRRENDRYESNNLLSLFGLVDKDNNSKLDPSEIERMKEYIRIVYKKEFDFDILDKDGDGCVSLQEFFEKFKDRKMEEP